MYIMLIDVLKKYVHTLLSLLSSKLEAGNIFTEYVTSIYAENDIILVIHLSHGIMRMLVVRNIYPSLGLLIAGLQIISIKEQA